MKALSILFTVALLTLSGCKSSGPNIIRSGRLEYNKALAQSASEQLLLNIVKMRFLDHPVFLKVTSMSSNISFESQIGSETTGIFNTTAFPTSFSPQFTWKDNPTVTYEELTGAEYVRQMLSPIPAETIVLMLQSWPADIVLALAVNEINNVNNMWNPVNPGFNAAAEQEHEHFTQIIKTIQQLDAQRALEWSVTRSSSTASNTLDTAILLNHPNDSKTQKLVNHLLTSLGLSKAEHATTTFAVQYGVESKDDATIVFGTRSIRDILFFASLDVDIPRSEIDSAVPLTPHWNNVNRDRMLHIKSSESEPNNAAVAIPYRGYWYFIENNDMQSKAAFLFMQVLMGMQSGATSSGRPVLTIPISS